MKYAQSAEWWESGWRRAMERWNDIADTYGTEGCWTQKERAEAGFTLALDRLVSARTEPHIAKAHA